jgi:hypothetical protein
MVNLFDQPIPGEILIGIGLLLIFIGPFVKIKAKLNTRLVGIFLISGGVLLIASLFNAFGAL